MPQIMVKNEKGEDVKKYISKKDLKKMRKQPAWNPQANGKLVQYPDGSVYEVYPSGWKRRRDVEQKLQLKKTEETK